MSVGIVLLAAGASSRMGSPKQLLLHGDATLLEHAIGAALASICRPVVVVLGADHDRIRDAVDFSEVRVVINENWQSGLASSLRCGLEGLCDIDPNLRAMVVAVCDQPALDSSTINRLVDSYESSGCAIVASRYANVEGVPALFARRFFDEIVALEGDSGARALIKRNSKHVQIVDFPEGAVDIDTPDDYRRHFSMNQSITFKSACSVSSIGGSLPGIGKKNAIE